MLQVAGKADHDGTISLELIMADEVYAAVSTTPIWRAAKRWISSLWISHR
jgi:hypothetical protein